MSRKNTKLWWCGLQKPAFESLFHSSFSCDISESNGDICHYSKLFDVNLMKQATGMFLSTTSITNRSQVNSILNLASLDQKLLFF
jgi:hypothetical protein